MRCAACGAHNPETAAWCTLCLRSLTEAQPPEGRVSAHASPHELRHAPRPAPHDGGPAGSGDPSLPGNGPEPLSAEGFRRRGEIVEWACARCGAYTPLERSVCDGCGASLRERFASQGASMTTPGLGTFVLDAAAPGLGHARLGRAPAGVARLVLYLVWLVGGLMLLAAGGLAGAAMAVPLLLGAFAIWAGSLAELALLERGTRLLDSRVLLWMVIGVLVLAAIGGTAAAAGASG